MPNRCPGATSWILSACVGLLPLACDRSGPQDSDVDWPVYLGDRGSSQYSPLRQIHRRNVVRLVVAWEYRTGGADPAGRSQIQCNPLVVDGVLYATSPGLEAFALDAGSGEPLWTFDPFAGDYGLHGLGVNRGLAYWSDGEGDRRVFYSAGSRLYALGAETGRPVESFGKAGSVDLHIGLGEEAADLFVVANTPGVVYRDLLILGTRVAESLPAAPGDVRAFDVRTGALVWTFRTVPEAGDLGADTWPVDARRRSGGANAWAGMSLDEERGLLFVPTGSAAFDFYGADRVGANLFANTLLALDADTGERVWHFQLVHHDLWDRDLPAPPNLVTLERNGRRVDGVAQITKSGHVFLFDRRTGEPLFPVEEVAVPASDLEGEEAWPTQPIPVRPPPFSRQRLTEEEVTDRTPEARAHVLDRLRRLRSGGQFVPPSREGTVIFPGFDGGGEWGGAAFDPESGWLYVNSSEMAWILTMVELSESDVGTGRMVYATHCQGCHGVDRAGDPLGAHPPLLGLEERLEAAEVERSIREGKGTMPAFPFLDEAEIVELVAFLFDRPSPPSSGSDSALSRIVFGDSGPRRLGYRHTGYHRFLDPDGYPAVRPPWGLLSAIDLNRGEIVWQVPLGEYPELSARGLPVTGTENYGGPVVTAGGLVFIAATKDERFRAFDKESGELLWETELPAGGYATPATYSVDGRQYVVIAAGGGKMGTPSGDAYVAFALPEGE